MDADALTRELGHRFDDPGLLRTALTHRSHSAQHNERLEFLGDSVLNCVIADELYRRFPRLAEGELSRARAIIVRQQSLFERAQSLGIGGLLLLGEGELRSGGERRPSILADAERLRAPSSCASRACSSARPRQLALGEARETPI